MNLTIQTLFTDPNIVQAIIDRVLQLRLDTIYWKQYGDFLETKTRVFKTYLGTVTGVVAGSILGKNDQKPIRERRSLGSGYTEIAYLGDRYQMDIERLSQLQDIIDSMLPIPLTSVQSYRKSLILLLMITVRFCLLHTSVWILSFLNC
jgi:hypothetical protein